VIAVAALLGGIALLAWASDQFVIGAARLAAIRGISPLVIGIVIIGFGTSSPELVVSALAALRGEPAVAVGNVVGSNLANLGLIMGIGVVIFPLAVESRTVRVEAPLAVAAAVLFAVTVQAGIGRVEGGVLVAAMVAALLAVTRRSPGDPIGPATTELTARPHQRLRTEVLRTVAGLTGTLAAAQVLLWGALELATAAGLDEGFVGATIVAVGTSLPELVTVVQSARRRQGDLIVGNLLGSNIFNALLVAGVAGLLGGGALDAPRLTGLAAACMVAQGVVVVAMMRTGRRITRLEGALLLASYGALVPFLAGG
jgi:cation:H+ antiporter